MYGELEVGETYPSQKKKTKKKVVKKKSPAKVKTVGFGKKVGGGVSAYQKKLAAQRKLLESMD